MKILILLFLFSLNGFAGELIPMLPQPSDYFHRCTYLSISHKVVHNFQIKQTNPYKCFYSIEVDDKLFKQYSAYGQDCEQYIRDQVNRGSICINNFVY